MELLHTVFNTYKRVVVFEEGAIKGGAGSAVLEFASQYNYNIPIELEGVPDQFISHGKPKNLLKDLGLDTEGICKKLDSILNKNEE